MKKFILSALSLMMAITMSAITYQSQVTITLDDGTYLPAIVVGESDDLADGINNGYAGEIQNLGEMPLAIYAIYGGVNYSTFASKRYVNLPVGIKTTEETTYHLYFDDVVGTVNLYDKKLGAPVPVSEGGDYEFTIENGEKNSILNDRFVINYNYVNLNGDFDNPDGGGAWIWLNDFVEHGLTATKEYTLPANAWCHFKVVENGDEYADGFAFDESNNSHQFTATGWTEQLTLHTGEAGVYTFTWNYTTNTLEITFPAAPIAYSVTTNEYGWASYSNDVDLALPAGLTAYKGAISGEVLTLSPVDYVKAAEGVIVKGAANTTYDFAVGNGTADFGGNAIKPSSAWASHTGTIYCLKGDALYQYTGSEMPANKAYIQIGGSSAPQRIRMVVNHTTGIEDVEAAVKAEKFVENGQIFIRRGEHVYDLQGQIVK